MTELKISKRALILDSKMQKKDSANSKIGLLKLSSYRKKKKN